MLTLERGTFERVGSVEGSAFLPVELTLTVESVFYTMRLSHSPVAFKQSRAFLAAEAAMHTAGNGLESRSSSG